MRKTENITIADKNYQVMQLDAFEAFKKQCYLASLLRDIADILSNKNALAMIKSTLMNLDDPKFHNFFKEMCESAKINNANVVFNRDFEGDLVSAWKLFIFVIKVNYVDFIKGGATLIKEIAQIANA